MSSSNSSTLFLLDASSYLFRAYYAIRPLSNSKGIPTQATYGFTQMLLKLMEEHKPTHFVSVWDSKEPNFRKKLYPEYKSHRKETPKDLHEQVPWIKKILQAMKVPSIEEAGFEADDLIGMLTKKAEKTGMRVVILSPDKDLMQLVSKQVTLLDTMRDRVTDIAAVKERFRVPPEQLTQVLALSGDASDHIPGVPGIGEKTAGELIERFTSLENLYAHLDEIKGKKRELLEQHKEMAFLSRKLVTLETEQPKNYDLEDFVWKPEKTDELRKIFEELEFHRLLSHFKKPETIERSGYRLVIEDEDFEALCLRLKQADAFSFDTETDGLNPLSANLVGISFGFENNEAYYLPLRHETQDDLSEQKITERLKKLKPLFENSKIKKYAQNFKYDFHVLKNEFIDVQGLISDTMIASYLLDPASSHRLSDLSERYLGHTMILFEEVTKQKGRKNFKEVPLEEALAYSAEDAAVTFGLAGLFSEKLKEEKLEELFEKIEIPLIPILAGMERAGIKIDRTFLEDLKKEFEQRMDKIQQAIDQISGQRFNLQSPKQLAEVLFHKLKLPVQKKTKTGYSTDSETLAELAKLHPLPEKILDYRSLAKLKSTYVEALLTLADPKNDRVHTSFNQTVAETGRLSSSNPNLQNIPIKTEDGRKIRCAFIAEPGCFLISADYSQIELRVLAHLSEEPALIDAFHKNQDVHALSAASIFDLPISEITKELRAIGKTVNFGILYGQSAFSLASQIGVSTKKAQGYIDQYFERYQAVKRYRERILDQARKTQVVHTAFGRKRIVSDLSSKNRALASNAERVAFNTVIQGTAADLIKLAMIRIDEQILKKSLDSKLLLQVHDELVFEVPSSEKSLIKHEIKTAMEEVVDLKVPLSVDLHEGKSWEK